MAPVRTPKEEVPGTHDKTGAFKRWVITFLVLDLLALGGFLYVKLVVSREADKTYNQAERHMLLTTRRVRQLNQLVSTISSAQIAAIADPGPLIAKVAEAMSRGGGELKFKDQISVGSPTDRRWNESYEEVIVPVTFYSSNGYLFGDLVRFLQRIEKKNPRILIREMDFGERQAGADQWRPQSRALEVRTFRPST